MSSLGAHAIIGFVMHVSIGIVFGSEYLDFKVFFFIISTFTN